MEAKDQLSEKGLYTSAFQLVIKLKLSSHVILVFINAKYDLQVFMHKVEEVKYFCTWALCLSFGTVYGVVKPECSSI